MKESTTMKKEIIEKLKNRDVAQKIMKAENSNEILKILKSEGVEIAEKEAEEILQGRDCLKSKFGELDESELEKCAGGSNLKDEIGVGATCVIVALGAGIGIGKAFLKDKMKK